ncbi:hypothetical protein BVRB_4g082150 [Beta vulgaris subsp. vulgaris]|nr:hypothetical protein BVRB_4g082150 [Beta vulgaris subsp. vulgaris]
MSLRVILATFVASLQIIWVNGQQPQVPCLFIFGDSLSDSGNNNPLLTAAKCNFPPYGVDFPDGPTGRFTNGRTTIDLIGDHLGLPGYIKAFPSIPESEIARGVNYASGSAGILNETGLQVGQRICMNTQMDRHRQIITKIKAKYGKEAAEAHLNQCLYSIYVGSNDWMFNYFVRPSVMATHMIPHTYGDQLLAQLTSQIDDLLDMGAKKVIMFGLSPLGCLPILNMIKTCSPVVNAVLKWYNGKLKELVDKYNNRPGVKFIYINTMDIISADNLKNIAAAGIKNTNRPCCGVAAECVPFSIPCQDRDKRAYWDQEHPTEAANKILAGRAFKAQEESDAYPMDISALASLPLTQGASASIGVGPGVGAGVGINAGTGLGISAGTGANLGVSGGTGLGANAGAGLGAGAGAGSGLGAGAGATSGLGAGAGAASGLGAGAGTATGANSRLGLGLGTGAANKHLQITGASNSK